MRIILSANSHWNIFNFRLGLVKELLKNNEVYIFGSKDQTSNKLKRIGCRLINIKISHHGKSVNDDFKLFLNYLSLLRKINPHYYFGFTIKPNIYGALACRILNIKSVSNITGLGEIFINKGALEKFVIFLYRLSIRHSKFVLFQNKEDLKYFKQKQIIKNNHKIIPGSGINLKIIKVLKKKSINKMFTFLYVGRIIKEKGILELIKAFSLLNKEFKNIQLILVGKIDLTLKKKLNLKQFNNIKYYKFTNKISAFYKKSDCFVMPSYREGLSRSILEAASYQMPILASDVPGCRELVLRGENGFLFKSQNSYSIFRSMKKLLSKNNEEIINMGKKSRLIVEKNYEEKKVIDVYKKIINEN